MVEPEVVEPEMVGPEVIEPDWMRELAFWNNRREGRRHNREGPRRQDVDGSCSVIRRCNETSPSCPGGLRFVEPTKRTVPQCSTG